MCKKYQQSRIRPKHLRPGSSGLHLAQYRIPKDRQQAMVIHKLIMMTDMTMLMVILILDRRICQSLLSVNIRLALVETPMQAFRQGLHNHH